MKRCLVVTKLGLAGLAALQINPATNRTVIFTYGRSAYVLTP